MRHPQWRSQGAIAALLLAIPLVVGFPIVGHPPVFDDHLLLGGNADILEGRRPAREAFFRRYWGSAPEATLNELYRPVAIASLAADARLAGSGPRGMHVTALLLHSFNTLLVYILVSLLFQRRVTAFLAALFFSINPIVLEVLAPLSGRADLLAGFFLLVASSLAILFVRGRGWSATPALAGSIVASALGVLSKEHVLTAPLVLGALLLAAGYWPERHRRILIAIGGSAAGVVAAVAQRVGVLGYLWRSGLPPDPQTAYLAWVGNPLLETGIIPRLLTVAKVVPKALGLLLLPLRQSADYCYDQITVEEGFPGLASLLGLGMAIACGAALLFWRRRHPVLWTGLAWSVLTFLLTSNALVPIGALFAERFLYLPAIGASLAIGAFLDGIARSGKGRPIVAAAAAAILAILYIALFVVRIPVWSSDGALFAATAQSSPSCARGHSNHGLTLQRAGHLEEAAEAYRRALVIAPGLTGAGISLTGSLLELDRFEAAAEAARKTAATAGDDAAARRLLADLLVTAGLRAIDAGDDRGFLVTTEAAAAIDPAHGTAHFNLALHAYRAKDLEAARRHTRNAVGAGYRLPDGFLKAVGMEDDQAPVLAR